MLIYKIRQKKVALKRTEKIYFVTFFVIQKTLRIPFSQMRSVFILAKTWFFLLTRIQEYFTKYQIIKILGGAQIIPT